jgi:expansin (peptidoglycan-binding protein)
MSDHRRTGRPVRRWILAGGGAVLAVVAAVLLLVQVSGGAACAAAPALAPPVLAAIGAGSGTATFYDLTSGGGNCSYVGPPADGLFVALGPSQYAAGAACGGYLDVTGPHGRVRVKIVDQCPECATGHLDLSRTAFARIADPVAGLVSITYRPVTNPSLPAPLSVRVKEGSSRYWLAILVIDHGNPLTAVAARTGSGGWQSLHRTDYNYWLAGSGLGPGPFQVRITDNAGHQVTVPGIRLSPGAVQKTTLRMYGAAARAATSPSHSPTPPHAPSVLPSPSPDTAGSTGSTTVEPSPSAAATACR